MKKSYKKTILVHACCGPCSTTAIEELDDQFDLNLFWYNPNIEPVAEHDRRKENLLKLASVFNLSTFADYDYKTENAKWHKFITGLENCVEGSTRCQKCFEFRLSRAGKVAKKYDFFTTTLTVSPHKNSDIINTIGKELGDNFMELNLKKNNGYLRSIELSKKYDLYRQDYCGCQYSDKPKAKDRSS